jgi:hypothetical protein
MYFYSFELLQCKYRLHLDLEFSLLPDSDPASIKYWVRKYSI